LDDPRDDGVRPDEEPREEPVRSPWEPPSDGVRQEPPTGEYSPPAAEDRPGDDVFARLNAPVAEQDEPDDAHLPLDDVPPFMVAERDLLAEPERAPSKAATFVAVAIVVLAVLGILMSIAAVKLFTERAAMTAALDQSVDRLETAYAGPQASDGSKRRIAWLRKAIGEGDFGQAQAALDALGAPETARPSPLERPGGEPGAQDGQGAAPGEGGGRDLPSPRDDTDLPLKAQVFFEQHPELWEAFFGFTVAIARMEQNEMQVDELKQLRSGMVDAATLGQADRVEELLTQARAKLERQSADSLPPALQTKLQEFGQAMQQAQRETRDPSQALAFAKRSERAAQQGDFKRAEELMDKAITALKSAPRMRVPRRPAGGPGGAQARGMPPMSPEIGLIKFVADVAMNVMRSEERDLTQIWESINIAAGAIREKNADQIREILDEAKDSFHVIGERRREMQGAIQQAQEQVREARGGQGGERPEGPQRPDRQAIVERVAGILAKVREMPDEEFQSNRQAIAQAVLEAMTAPVQAPPDEAQEGPELTPEQRVSAKMERAGNIYLMLKEQEGVDVSALDDTFKKVRELIAEHQYEQAEKLVDEGMAAMREMAGDAAPDGAGGAEGYGPQLQFDAPAPTLDLRGANQPPVPPAADTSDHTDEGAEQ